MDDELFNKLTTELEYVVDANTLQDAKLRFQEILPKSVDPMRLRKVVWPFLFGNEYAQLRADMFGTQASEYG